MADSKAGSGGQGPLAGIVVLDMSQGIAGPSCGGHFAEFGAKSPATKAMIDKIRALAKA